MKLLIVTQKVDMHDATLGFFHTWLTAFAGECQSIHVVCLEEGQHRLPANVTVHSLGKEKGFGRLRYVFNFFRCVYGLAGSYDHVFVHMNQEYILLAGWYWWYTHIPVYFWRNHPRGGLLTRLAVLFSTKVFCTSPDSFTARFKKTMLMPVGIDADVFHVISGVVRKKYSVCMVGRIAPIKHIELGLEAVYHFVQVGGQISMSIIGSATPARTSYYEGLKTYVAEKNLAQYVNFLPAVFPGQLPDIYNNYEVCLNLTEAGSFDKTIVEAAACGTIPVVSNASFCHTLPAQCVTESKPEKIAETLQNILTTHTRSDVAGSLESFVHSHSLTVLTEKLFQEMNHV